MKSATWLMRNAKAAFSYLRIKYGQHQKKHSECVPKCTKFLTDALVFSEMLLSFSTFIATVSPKHETKYTSVLRKLLSANTDCSCSKCNTSVPLWVVKKAVLRPLDRAPVLALRDTCHAMCLVLHRLRC